jgi:hypothetical protein
MSEKRQAITILWNEFMRAFLPKLDKLSPEERLVCARLLKATLERYIETNDTK